MLLLGFGLCLCIVSKLFVIKPFIVPSDCGLPKVNFELHIENAVKIILLFSCLKIESFLYKDCRMFAKQQKLALAA